MIKNAAFTFNSDNMLGANEAARLCDVQQLETFRRSELSAITP